MYVLGCGSFVSIFAHLYIHHSTVLLTIHTIDPDTISELRSFEDIDTSFSITWKPPKEPNGVIVAYFVEYGMYQIESTTSGRILAGGPMYTVIQALGKCLPFHIIYI